jgi:purine-binding chemotaxis protein CheW
MVKKTGNIGNMKSVRHYLVFSLSRERFGLPLESVQRVVHAVEVTRLPRAPEIVCGLINYKGRILPVLNIARRFKLEERDIEPGHNFVIVHTRDRQFALVADDVSGVMAQPGDMVAPPSDIITGMEFLVGIMKLENGMMLIPDLDHLMTHEEEEALKAAVGKKPGKKKHA